MRCTMPVALPPLDVTQVIKGGPGEPAQGRGHVGAAHTAMDSVGSKGARARGPNGQAHSQRHAEDQPTPAITLPLDLKDGYSVVGHRLALHFRGNWLRTGDSSVPASPLIPPEAHDCGYDE